MLPAHITPPDGIPEAHAHPQLYHYQFARDNQLDATIHTIKDDTAS